MVSVSLTSKARKKPLADRFPVLRPVEWFREEVLPVPKCFRSEGVRVQPVECRGHVVLCIVT